ncbi:MAG: Eco29kI restriction endonuclease [Candidatus Latescibacteria bacterium ADurb.Bin168]|nr:MAG: Eco29kI restriction endonuclease [Candidatus Latescibacteria bacterium ADurb.Bin168]
MCNEDAVNGCPFNPLDKKNLGQSVTDALLEQTPTALPPGAFFGAGVYAIYYTGTFEPYLPLAALNADDEFMWPIYVGKAVPAGTRKGTFGLESEPGQFLYKRLGEHASSIDQTTNLSLGDFSCRFLVVDDIWIPLAESLLIARFNPLWNSCLDGFGNHDPGGGRSNQKVSDWDVIHPGRAWAAKLAPSMLNQEDLEHRVAHHFAQTLPRSTRE